MIEMQYNFPLLLGQGEQWRQRLRQAVEQLRPDNADELRPTFRMQRLEQRAIAAKWLGSQPETTWIVCGGHHGTLVSLLAAGLPGRAIAVETVTYTGILEQARMLGSPLVGIEYDSEGMSPDALRSGGPIPEPTTLLLLPAALLALTLRRSRQGGRSF